MLTVGENVEYSSPKQNSKHEEIAAYNGPKHNTKHDAQHPPTLYTSKSLNLRNSIFRRTKTTSEIAKKTVNEEECRGKVRVLDQPDKWCIYRVPSKLRKVNEAAYTPQLLSIGPFHHGKPELKDMETHKKIYYENFLARWTIELDIDPANIIVNYIMTLLCLSLAVSNPEKKYKNRLIVPMTSSAACLAPGGYLAMNIP
ncbi:unnamed protein product [Prunus armeniaca]